jgi:hypothetical protein
MKLAGNTSPFPNPKHQLLDTVALLVGQGCMQVEAGIIDAGMNLAKVPALLMVLEMVFGDPDCMATAEQNLEVHKWTNCNFSTGYAEF